jgi:hypothetical protein
MTHEIGSRIKTGRSTEDQRRLRWNTETLQRSSEERGFTYSRKKLKEWQPFDEVRQVETNLP